MIKKKEKRSAWYFISYTNNRTGFDRLTGLTKYSLLHWGDGKAGTEVQAKLIQTTEVCTVCGLPTVQLQLQHALQPSVATYDPTIISISITPAAGKTDLVPTCMFTLQHVDCVGIYMHVDIDTQTFSCVALPTHKLLVVLHMYGVEHYFWKVWCALGGRTHSVWNSSFVVVRYCSRSSCNLGYVYGVEHK